MLPEAIIQQAKSADIIEVANKHGLKPTRKGQDTYLSLCPFHEDKDPSLSLSPKKGLYHCHGCNASGNVIQLVEHLESIGFREAVEMLVPSTSTTTKPKFSALSLALLEKYEAEQAANPEFTFTKPELLECLAQAFAHMTEEYQRHDLGKDYLIGERGIKLDPKLTQVGFCNFNFTEKIYTEERRKDRAALKQAGVITKHGTPFFISCIVFPLKDLDGKIISLYGRKCSFTSDSQKNKDNDIGRHYFSPTEHLCKERGIYSIGHSGARVCYITESIHDALALYQAGAEQVLALHGVNGYTPLHEAYLKKEAFSEIRILLDGDNAGREASARLSLKLKEQGYNVNVMDLPDGEDPASYFAEKKLTMQDLGNPEAQCGFESLSHQGDKPIDTITRNGDELAVLLGQRTYTIKGLSPAGSDSLKVTIKVTLTTNPSFFFLDKLDLYLARNRQNFVEGLCSKFKSIPNTKSEAIEKELDELIAILENERKNLQSLTKNEPTQNIIILSDSEKAEALKLLRTPGLLDRLTKDIETLGTLGEEKGKKLCYLGACSRFLKRPFGVVVVSRSGAGKTTLQNCTLAMLPPESIIKYSRLSAQSLFYMDKDALKNKVLAIEEEEGVASAMYGLKLLQSDQRLSQASVKTDPKTGRLQTVGYEVEGPVFILIASTNPGSLGFETRNRFIIATIDESSAQTKRILEYRKNQFTHEHLLSASKREALLKLWHNAQRLLKPLPVLDEMLPFYEFPAEVLQDRREFEKYTALVYSSALLHQYQREIRNGAVVVAPEDVAIANEIAMTFFPNSFDEMAPHTRNLGLEISRMIEQNGGDCDFDRKGLRDFCKWSNWSICQGLDQLLELGYVTKLSGQNGIQYKYRMMVDVAAEQRRRLFLTSPEELLKRMEGKNGNGRG